MQQLNANAQRDNSVLERYHADGDRQLSALENSEELGDELLTHNKDLIRQTGELNQAKVNAAESDAALKEGVNAATVEGYSAVISGYQSIIEENEKELEELTKKKEELDNEIAGLDEGDENLKSKEDELKGIKGEIASINGKEGTLTQAIKSLETLVSSRTTASTLAQNGHPVAVSHSGIEDPLAQANNRIDKYTVDGNGNVVDTGTRTEETVNIRQVPQAIAPANTGGYLSESANNFADLTSKMNALLPAQSGDALSNTGQLKAPPIERIRNDEAVFDYLIDGYRNTKIYSGAEYGGMVRRVLPFSFTFTPGKDTRSGFSARVRLVPDGQQIIDASRMIAPHLNAVNRDRIKGYIQRNEQAEENRVESRNLSGALLEQEYNPSCSFVKFKEDIDSSELPWEKFSLEFEDEDRLFWKAYSGSIEVIRKALERSLEENSIQASLYLYETPSSYKYDLTAAISSIANKVKKVRAAETLESRGVERKGIYSLARSDISDYRRLALTNICQLQRTIDQNLLSKRNVYTELLNDIDQLAIVMTSAGQVYDYYLQSNPIFASEDAKIITMTKDGTRYNASIKKVAEQDIKGRVADAAKLRIVQNTSREHVVEIADTAKINTLLNAALTANEVSSQLGLTLGAELAAAVSSSSAFIKRIPYAVPITGQSFSSTSSDKVNSDDVNQVFGWRYYKTPSGVTQFGGVAQAFKTIPLNSSVVVSMPEWISKLRAIYEVSEDAGKTWRPVGGENITLSGASLRGLLAGSETTPFDTWVKYHIYREVNGSVGLPKIKSCYGDNNIIYGNSGGDTAICGENLQGVKAVLVAGQYIDDGIEKVSSNLIKIKDLHLDIDDCPAASYSDNSDKCRVILLTDFGASTGGKPHYLQFSFKEPGSDLSALVGLDVPEPSVEATEIEFNFSSMDILTHYNLSDQREIAVTDGEQKAL